MQGWIKLHRQILDNCIANKPEYLSLWIHLLLLAQHEEGSFIWNNKKQTLKIGQLITGRKKLSLQTGISESQIYKILNFLEKEQQIEQQKNNRFTIITIVNWDLYQEKEQQNNNRITTEKQPSNTYKNVKNDKNVNNIISKDIINKKQPNPQISEVINYFENKIGSKLDGTIKDNRFYCNNLLRKIKQQWPDKNEVQGAIALIDVAINDDFHQKNATNIKYIFYNIQKIIKSYQTNQTQIISIN